MHHVIVSAVLVAVFKLVAVRGINVLFVHGLEALQTHVVVFTAPPIDML